MLMSCSEEIYEYEEMVRQELKANDRSMSEVEIKKWALYLSKWSEPDFYHKEIREFKDQDALSFPKKNSILFVGSSSIVYWKNLKEAMHPFEVLNRGFGGAHIDHVNHHFSEVVSGYNPRGIVFFCGTNDLAALKVTEDVFSDFLTFFNNVNTFLPETKVFVIGVKPSIAREHLKNKELKLNKLISDHAKKHDNLFFVDVWDKMLLDNGKADPALFVDDGLHMNEEGYKVWNKIIKPFLESNFSPDKT